MRSCVVRNRFSSLFAKGCLHTDGDAKLAESIFQTCSGMNISKKFIEKMKNMGLKNFDNSNKINLHTFAVCAYGESPYLEECVQSLLAQKVRTRILIATSTPNSYIYGIGEKYGIPVHINHGEKGLAGDWNFAYSCATTPLVTLAHQDDRYYVNYTEDVLAAAKKCRHPLIIFTDYNELRNGKTVTTNRLLR